MAVLETQTPAEIVELTQAAYGPFFSEITHPPTDLHSVSEAFMLQHSDLIKKGTGLILQNETMAVGAYGIESTRVSLYFDERKRAAGEYSWQIIYAGASGKEVRHTTVTPKETTTLVVVTDFQGTEKKREVASTGTPTQLATSDAIAALISSPEFNDRVTDLRKKKEAAEKEIGNFACTNGLKMAPRKFKKELRKRSETAENIGFTPLVPANLSPRPNRAQTYEECVAQIEFLRGSKLARR
jgi:hypothetical protein